MMREQSFRNGADGTSRLHGITHLDSRCEIPVAVGDGIQIDASLQEETAFLCQLRQRILQTVKHLGQKSRSQIHAHEFSGEFHRVPHLDAVRHLVDLHTHDPVVDPDDLALQALALNKNVTHLILADRTIEINIDQVAVDSGYKSCFCFHTILLLPIYSTCSTLQTRDAD